MKHFLVASEPQLAIAALVSSPVVAKGNGAFTRKVIFNNSLFNIMLRAPCVGTRVGFQAAPGIIMAEEVLFDSSVLNSPQTIGLIPDS
jgi:hypothetical protein